MVLTSVWAAAVMLIAAGCAGRPVKSLSDRLVRGDVPQTADWRISDVATPVDPPATAAPERPLPETIEAHDPRLAAALRDLAGGESAEALVRVAIEYSRVGVLDRADALLTRAVAIDGRYAGAYAARARVWRDWGWPARALPDAHRAVYLSPASPDAHTTLGSVLLQLGAHREALDSFRKVLELAPEAAWAYSNVCYATLMAGQVDDAAAWCERALSIDAGLTAARNNLGLVHAVADRMDQSRAAFLNVTRESEGLFNLGIVRLARREFALAGEAFRAACRQAPEFEAACRRARDAELRAREGERR
jgi:Tfp pilus assembly protein PilF